MNTRIKTIVSLGCALLSAVFLGLFVYQTSHAAQNFEKEMIEQYGGQDVELLVVAKTIRPGEKLQASSFEKKVWPAALVPEGVVLSHDAHKLVGKQACAIMFAGEPVVSHRVDKLPSGLSDIPQGFQGLTIATDPVRALGGDVSVGMRIDLLCPSNSGSTDLLSGGVEVIATSNALEEVGESISKDLVKTGQGDIEWVTLSVRDESVDAIIAAAFDGKIYMTLPGTREKGTGK